VSVLPLRPEAILFACLSSGWATTKGRLLGLKMRNSIKCLSQGQSDAIPHRESNQGFATIRLLALRLILLTLDKHHQNKSTKNHYQKGGQRPVRFFFFRAGHKNRDRLERLVPSRNLMFFI